MPWEELIEFVKPELLILIPVLYFIGKALKKSKFPDCWIPAWLGIIGIVLSAMWILSVSPLETFQDVMGATFMAITHGVLTAGMSVYINEIRKQFGRPD